MLNIQYHGNGIEITAALKTFIHKKSVKLQHHFQDITALTVNLSVERGQHIAEGTVSTIGKPDYNAVSDTTDMYHSIDEMMDKLNHQLMKNKEKMLDARDKRD